MILAIVLIISGEALGIFSEIYGARLFSTHTGSPFLLFMKAFSVMIVGGGLLLAGYMIGYKNFKNIWIVSAVSISSVLVIEPILNFTLFHQPPTRGALNGLIFEVLGIISATVL